MEAVAKVPLPKKGRATKHVLQSANGAVPYPAIASFDPHAFYKTGAGLWISDYFRDNVLPQAKKVKNISF